MAQGILLVALKLINKCFRHFSLKKKPKTGTSLRDEIDEVVAPCT